MSVLLAIGLLLAALAPLLAQYLVVTVRRRDLRRAWLATEERATVGGLTGHKTAQVLLRADGARAVFCGITAGRSYAAEDTAACYRPHCAAPGLDCECGFYAFKTREEALELLDPGLPLGGVRSKAVLTVELSGRVLEYERGFRAERQAVHRVEFSRWCAGCTDVGMRTPATTLAGSYRHRSDPIGRPDLRALLVTMPDHLPLRPVCADHVPLGPETRTLAPVDLAGLLGTEVGWLPEPVEA